MEPKDLKNSDEELRATPEENGVATAPQNNTETDAGKQKSSYEEDETVAEDTPVSPEIEEPVAATAEDTPVSPEVEEPVAATEEDTPVSPEVEEPVAATEEGTPASPEVEEPVAATAEDTPVSPEVEESVAATAEGTPVSPEVEEPVEATAVGTSASPEVEEPVAATAEDTPVSPAAEDFTAIVAEVIAEETPFEQEEAQAQARQLPVEEESISRETTRNDIVKNESATEEDELDEETANVVISKGKIDYSSFTEVELINSLRELLSKADTADIKEEIDRIRINFAKKHHANAEEEKKRFLEEGGAEEDFSPSNSVYKDDLENLLKDFKQMKSDQMKVFEEQKEHNLKTKYEIIEDIKSLVNRKESINKTFQEFRELQQRWRDIGPVPQSKLKDLWETYHHHIENFYDFIKINKELRDLDLKKNLEAKIILCEKAEELLVEPSTMKAFNTLQKLHLQWRETGPVPRDKKDEIWERFKAATNKINKKHQSYYEDRKKERQKNLVAKETLCEKAEEIASAEPKSHKEWDEKSKELIELQKVWKTIGFTPRKENNRIYERFRKASDKFFDAKREFYSGNREWEQTNLQLKTDLCIQAEALKESTDWKKTTDEFIIIQRKWKETGPVPRKFSDTIWKRFRAACDYFFDQKSKHFSDVDHDQIANLQAKKELINEVREYVLTGNEDDDLEQMKDFQRRWTEIGHVPFKEKDAVQNGFRDAVNAHFNALQIDDQKRSLLKFKAKVSNFSSEDRRFDKLRYEREKYLVKLKQMESDLALLNNNIGFFTNTKNAESLIDDVNRKISNVRDKIEFLKEKIRIIDEMEDGE